MNGYRAFFGLQQEPFSDEIALHNVFKTPDLCAVEARFAYTLNHSAVGLITGDIGSGKSTAIRYALSTLHPSQYNCIYVIATTGTITELYRQIATALHISKITHSKALMTRLIRDEILKITAKKVIPVLIIDEASLLRFEVLSEVHTLLQFEQDAKLRLPLFLVGQASLLHKLAFPACLPLASRVISRCHMQGISLEDMHHYIAHHLKLCGIEHSLFEEAAITAIHQGSAGLLRKANYLARGALLAAAKEKARLATAEHVRKASTELI